MILVSILRDYQLLGYRPAVSDILLSASFLFNLVPEHQEGVVWASWTISVEMLFYLTFLPIYRLGPRFQVVVGVAALFIFAALNYIVPIAYLYWSFLGFFPLFVIGMLTFEIYSRVRVLPKARTLGTMSVFAGFVLLVICATPTMDDKSLILRVPIGIGYGVLLLGCVLRNPSLLVIRPLLFFGRISYSLYLVHAPIEYACSGLFLAISSKLPENLSYAACAIVTLTIATPCALLIYEFVEKPGIRLGEKLLQRRQLRVIASKI
jgi:peptidoglycan/LPS O-acetylase OafA/YrhL